MISINSKGDWDATMKFLNQDRSGMVTKILEKYGKIGVKALKEATPVDTGLASGSWYYKIKRKKNRVELQFCNSDRNNGCPIAVILQYGHATRNGGWVEGKDYINPAIQPVFDSIVNEAWREVSKK